FAVRSPPQASRLFPYTTLFRSAGPGAEEQGDISGVFTVLVEGDDHNDPVADAVRSILDGHLVLDRAIAERGRFPPIDVLKSVSRDRKSTRLNSSHVKISYAVFC